MTIKKDTKHCEWLNAFHKQHQCCLTFKQKLRTLKAFQNLLIIAGHKENPLAHKWKRFDGRSGWKKVKNKKIWAAFLPCTYTYYSYCHKGVFQIILFNQLNLFICANICSVLMQPQLSKTSVIFTAYLSMTELWLSQTLVHWGCKIQRWQESDIKGDKRPNPKTNKQQQNLQSWKSEEVQFSVNPYLSEMFTDIHLQEIVLMKILSLQQ